MLRKALNAFCWFQGPCGTPVVGLGMLPQSTSHSTQEDIFASRTLRASHCLFEDRKSMFALSVGSSLCK